jgi:hypothetical protein
MIVDLAEGKGRGKWQRIILDEFSDMPLWSAVIWCPECALPMILQRGHRIAADGRITPSVGHPTSYPPCPWHTNPHLVGWIELPAPAVRDLTICAKCGAQSRALGGWGTWSGTGLLCPKCLP